MYGLLEKNGLIEGIDVRSTEACKNLEVGKKSEQELMNEAVEDVFRGDNELCLNAGVSSNFGGTFHLRSSELIASSLKCSITKCPDTSKIVSIRCTFDSHPLSASEIPARIKRSLEHDPKRSIRGVILLCLVFSMLVFFLSLDVTILEGIERGSKLIVVI